MKCLRCQKDITVSNYTIHRPLCITCRSGLVHLGVDLDQYVKVKRQELVELRSWRKA